MMKSITITASSLLLGACLMMGQNKAAPAKGDTTKGKEVFEQCAVCHSADNAETKMGPSLQGLYKHKSLKNGKPVNDASVGAQINAGGNGMPAYADQLSNEEKANLLAYLRTL